MGAIDIAKVAAGLTIGFAAACMAQAESEEPRPARIMIAAGGQSDSAKEMADIAVPRGPYRCTIERYDPFPCRISVEPDGRKRLEKLGGSQRFSGVITANASGFSFRGTYYCPSGSCTQAVEGDFVAYDEGLYRGKLSTDGPVTVTVQFAGDAAAAAGGSTYGGNTYGGSTYGGSIYGYRNPPYQQRPMIRHPLINRQRKTVPYKRMP